jgi:hypothetical protein
MLYAYCVSVKYIVAGLVTGHNCNVSSIFVMPPGLYASPLVLIALVIYSLMDFWALL